MVYKQYDDLELDFPNTPKESNPGQYELPFPNPNQYQIKFPNNSEFPSERPRELPPSKLEEIF